MKNKNIKRAIISLMMCFAMKISAQQTPVFSDYAYNAILLNPAHAGFYENKDLTVTYRNTSSNIEGSPSLSSAVFNGTTKSKNIGYGISAVRDNIGVTNITSFTGSYAYKIIFDHHDSVTQWWEYNPKTITFGISLGGIFYNEDLNSLDITNDPEFAQNINEFVPTAGVGFLYNRQEFYIGISNTNLLATIYRDSRNVSIASPNYLYGGLRIFTNKFEFFMLKPSFLLKYETNAAPQLDANFTANYKNIVEFGAGYRTNKSVNVLAGIYSKKTLRFLVSYNFAVKNQVLDSSLGLLLSYRFGKKL